MKQDPLVVMEDMRLLLIHFGRNRFPDVLDPAGFIRSDHSGRVDGHDVLAHGLELLQHCTEHVREHCGLFF